MKNVITVLMIGLTLGACKPKSTATSAANTSTDQSSPASASSNYFTPESTLLKKFERDFPNAKRVYWTKNNIRAFADFRNSAGFQSLATYGFDGALMENRVGIDVNYLPLTVKNYLNTNHPSKEVTNAYKVRNGYSDQHLLVKLQGADDVMFDLNGNYMSTKAE